MAEEKVNREGQNLLGLPTYKELDNGRFKCVETGHELPAKEMESYGTSKRCRLGLIDYALSHKKPPLNLFKQDPASKSKLVCKLTGDSINKSEEHIWKHISGRRFMNKLEEKEAGKLTSKGKGEEKDEHLIQNESKLNGKKGKKKKKIKKEKEKELVEIISEITEHSDKEISVEDVDFWMPPNGSRWDFDDGGDRWDSGSEYEHESDEVLTLSDGLEEEEGASESMELSARTKRVSIEVGPDNFAPRKKRVKPTC